MTDRPRRRSPAAVLAAFLVLVAGFAAAFPAPAAADGTPGDFDFYVLSLSWSPSWCESDDDADRSAQCTTGRRFAFVVHGLWPQYDRGWPDFCADGRRDRPSRDAVDAMLDIMPDPDLVRYQWSKHGTCSGLSSSAYLSKVRQARGRITIPPAYRSLERYVTVDPRTVERDFRAANPGLPADGIAVTCDRRRLKEVRICLTRDLAFTDCAEVDAGACRRPSVVMPPVR